MTSKQLVRVDTSVIQVIMDAENPLSAITQSCANRLMLKRHSSHQIMSSRRGKVWQKLFFWSRRNLQRAETSKPLPVVMNPALNQHNGYSADTSEPRRIIKYSKVPPNLLTRESVKNSNLEYDKQRWGGFQVTSGMLPQNQRVALPIESPKMARVDEWVKELSIQTPSQKDTNGEASIDFPPSPEASTSAARTSSYVNQYQPIHLLEEITYANSSIKTLKSSSTVARIAGNRLKVVPNLWSFSSLRSVNLSGNFVVHLTPGSLPLQTLNLSRSKITIIEGLRALTRLQVLDLSYNQISRIGKGLSNCALIKELYLAGNKISEVEGLHRLIKLTILDLSFNKITTTKALGNLAANYDSLLALNIIENPIQRNIHDDQLQKTVCILLPKLAFLNKQPINPQKERAVHTEAIAKVPMGNRSWSTHRRAIRKLNQGVSSSSGVHRSTASVSRKSRDKGKSKPHCPASLKEKLSYLASSSS